MNLANCPRCGKLFARGVRDVCPECVKGIEKEYEACATYLRENKSANIQLLSDETGVAIKQITKFIREGRISMDNAPNMSYPCESCGLPIREGHICDSCRGKIQRDMKHAQDLIASKSAPVTDPRAGRVFQIGDRKDRF